MADFSPAELATFFTAALKKIPAPVLLVDRNGQLISATEAAAALFIMGVNDIIGQQWAGLDAQLTHFAWKKQWQQLSNQQLETYDTDIVTSGDYLRPVQVSLIKASDEVAAVFLENCLDKNLKDKQLEYLDSHAFAGHWLYNRVDRKWHISTQARELLELDSDSNSREELLSMLGNRMITDDWATLQATVTKALEAPGEFTHLARVKTSRGISSLEIAGQSMGNDLEVTHLIGTIQSSDLKNNTGTTEIAADQLARFSIEQSTDLIFWTKPDGTFSYANHTAIDRLGYERKKLLSLPINTIVPAFDDEVKTLFWKKLREEHSFETEFTLIANDGTQVDIMALVNYFNIDGEEIACSFCRDIAERKLKESRQRLIEFSVDNSHDLILWTKPDGLIYFANEKFLTRTGYEREEVEGKPVHEFFLNSNPERIQSFWVQLREQRQMEIESSLRLKQGKYIPTHGRLNYLLYEGEEYDCIYLRDWTAKKERDVLVKLSREALDKTKDFIVWLEDDLTIRYLNQSVLNFLDTSPDSFLGKSFTSLLPDLSKREIYDGNLIDYKVAKKNGESKDIELKCTRLEYDDRSYYMLNGRDVTKRLERTEELELAYNQIEGLKDKLEEENITLREEVSHNYNVNNIITVSPKYQKVLRQVGRVADVDTTVLITGETGTGKELLARAIHQLSDREDSPMVKVNCAALPENLIESELFGHEKGAFTGATARKKGRFEMANGGTIFLDEIGEMPILLQSKLLRVLQEGEFERLGGTETITVDVRLIAATNRNLEEMVADGRFREDLYYRLNVFPIYNLPLRDRPEDISPLVEFFVRKFAKQQGKEIKKINTSDVTRLKSYHFPGNIRELENIIERAVVLSESETLSITLDRPKGATNTLTKSKFLTFEEMQRQYIIDALKATGGRVSGAEGAGVLLDMNDRTLMSKMRKLKIEKRDFIQ